MAKGRVKFFNENKGFGFIKQDGANDVFFHISNVVGGYHPEEDELVEYKTRAGQRGPEAYDVTRVEESSKMSGEVNTAGHKRLQGRVSKPKHTAPEENQANRHCKFPYHFKKRIDAHIDGKQSKQKPENRHHCLKNECCDIAFEVKWTALTPVAANPCSSGNSCPKGRKDEFQGYDKRWLQIGNRLCISPFTVKSAVANGFAALLGSCYRVNTEVVGHTDKPDPAKFPYSGGWKRYRVSMNNSRPGLLKSINYETGDVVVIPVTEYFYDEPEAPTTVGTFRTGTTYYISWRNIKHKKIINKIQSTYFPNSTKVKYYGPYEFGMNLTFGPGEFNKGHYDRFYEEALDKDENQKIILGQLNTLNLKSLKEQMKHVYMGIFEKYGHTRRHDHRSHVEGKPWHQDLTHLRPKHPENDYELPWIYYQAFNGMVAAIGLNFQFKTAFHVDDDAVPPDQHACRDRELLCPRCSMFGMTDENPEAVGFKGRFRASALVGPKVGKPVDAGHDGLLPEILKDIKLKKWTDHKNPQDEIARQLLLPIQGEPKPCKRDQTAYFDKKTGEISGVKIYRHAAFTYEELKNEIKRVNRCKILGDFFRPFFPECRISQDYKHALRNFAVVCRENAVFSGILGAENATPDEAAALVMLLEHDLGKHGFKIGLGKALGLGSMISEIKRVWIRKPDTYKWEEVGLEDLKEHIENFDKCLESLNAAQELLNQVELDEDGKIEDTVRLIYPPMGNNYWKIAEKSA